MSTTLLASPPPAARSNQARPPLTLNRSLRLHAGQYLQQPTPKDLIVLHHTAGGSAASTFNWWQNGDQRRIATAYIVARDGTIYEVFDPQYWAYHVGVRGTRGRIDRRSIGIEIASEGGLRYEAGQLYRFDRISPRHRFDGDAYDHGAPWRGYRYFAAYTEAQVTATIALVDRLCDQFGIARRTPRQHADYDRKLFTYQGIIGHQHIRADKSDVHPGFAWARLIDSARLRTT